MAIKDPFRVKLMKFLGTAMTPGPNGVPIEVWGFKCSPDAWVEQGDEITFPIRYLDNVNEGGEKTDVYGYTPECNKEFFEVNYLDCPDATIPISENLLFRFIESALICTEERCPETILVNRNAPLVCEWTGSIVLNAGTVNILLVYENYLGVDQWRIEFSGCVSPTVIKVLPAPTTTPPQWGDTLVLTQTCCDIPPEAEGFTGFDPTPTEDSTGILNWVIFGFNKPIYACRFIGVTTVSSFGGDLIEVWGYTECCDDTECPQAGCCETDPPENNMPVVDYTISNKTGSCSCLPDGGKLAWNQAALCWGNDLAFADDSFHCVIGVECEEDYIPHLVCCNLGHTKEESWRNFRYHNFGGLGGGTCSADSADKPAPTTGSCDPFLLVYDVNPTLGGSYRITFTKAA